MDKKKSIIKKESWYALATVMSIMLIGIVLGIMALKEVNEYIEGEADAPEFRVSSKVPARIKHFFVKEGDKIDIGDTLVTLEAPDVTARFIQAEALKNAAEALNQQSHSSARREVLQSTYEIWQKAVAGEALAKKTWQRVSRLYDEGVTTAQQRDEAEAAYKAASATEKAAHWQYIMASNGGEIEEREITAAKVKQAQGGVDEVYSFIEETVLISPTKGEVSEIYPQTDELVGSGAPIMSIAKMDELCAYFNVREDWLDDLKIGKEFTAYSPALRCSIPFQVSGLKDMGTYATWKSTRSTGDYDLKTFQVKALPLVQPEDLRPGMSLVIPRK